MKTRFKFVHSSLLLFGIRIKLQKEVEFKRNIILTFNRKKTYVLNFRNNECDQVSVGK